MTSVVEIVLGNLQSFNHWWTMLGNNTKNSMSPEAAWFAKSIFLAKLSEKNISKKNIHFTNVPCVFMRLIICHFLTHILNMSIQTPYLLKVQNPKRMITWHCHCDFFMNWLANSCSISQIFHVKSFKMRNTTCLCHVIQNIHRITKQ